VSIRASSVRRSAGWHPGHPSTSKEHEMKYMLLIYGAQPAEEPSAEAVEQIMNEYWAYEKAVSEAGVRLASDALQGIETATTVQVTEAGERVVTDGPFAETREILGGYYLIDVPDLDAALEWAARCPGAHHGSKIEVRPIMEFEEPSES
jgi:hypothetical protein